MTTNKLLEDLKMFTEQVTANLLLPVSFQEGDTEEQQRPAAVYKMRLPDSNSAKKKCPYILHQIVTTKTVQEPGQQFPTMRAAVRSIFAVYCKDEQEGALNLLNLMTRLQIDLQKQIVIGGQFQLDMNAGVETLVYPDNTAPYVIGEMSTTWISRSIRREVQVWP